MKKKISKALCVAFLLVCSPFSVAGYNIDSNGVIDQSEALNSYDKLQAYFGYPDDWFDENAWPATYGGCYLDNTDLVLCFTDLNDEIKKQYTEICGENIKFKEVTNTYNDLVNAVNLMVDNPDKLSCKGLHIGLDTENNVVDVKVSDISAVESIYELCKSIKNSKDGLFRITEDENAGQSQYTSYSCSDGSVINNVVSAYFSLGVWAYRAGQLGFITCGHHFWTDYYTTFDTNAVNVYYGNNQQNLLMGTTASYLSKVGLTYYDYTFVPVTSSWVGTNSCYNGYTIDSVYSSNPLQSQVVYGCGAIGGTWYGEIAYNNSVSILYSTVTQAYEMELTSTNGIQFGDSGCPIYFTQNGEHKLLSFQSAMRDDHHGYSTRADLTFTRLGATLFT